MDQTKLNTIIQDIIEDKLGPVETMQAEREFVRLLMQERAERKQLWQKVKQNVVGHTMIILLSGLGYLGWQIAKFLFNHAPEFIREWGSK
jgi:hypothetical protein